MYRTIGILLLTALIISAPAFASDSLMTIADMGSRVFANLNFADTATGADILDTHDVRRYVRDAVVEVGADVGAEKAKTITTASGTFSYLIDKHFDSLRAVMLKKGSFSELINFGTFSDFAQAYERMAHTYDTSAYQFAAIHGDSLYLYPIPPRTDTIYLFYWARGKTPTAAADTIDLPHELYSAVEYLATAKSAAKIGNADRLKVYFDLYKDEIANFAGGKTPQ